MKTKKLFLLLSLITLISSCSKGVEKTSAKLSLKLAGIVNLSSGIGSGGAILFGKNAAGETFGKKIDATEVDIDIPNGAWVFYALMWSNDSTPMNGKVHCGKSINQLNGTATTISMSLTNANCTDPEFSGGKFYLASTLNRFADIFIEECDEVNAATIFSCGKKNQGSALSYRFVFNNYKKTSAGFTVEGESLVSECKTINSSNSPSNIYSSGLPINFPSGGLGTPFVGSVEFFMSSINCDINDPKGVHRFPLRQGLATSTAPEHRVLVSSNSCSPSTPDFVSGTQEDKKNKCEMFFGNWTGTDCSGTLLPVATRFGASACATPTASNIAIKHQFALPKPVLCGPYINNSLLLGAHPFAGGDGSVMRPYKICTEWQLNQIGERNTVIGAYDILNYKLLNDLDMNKASNISGVGVYTPPTCIGNVTSGIDNYHNLNPLDGHLCGAGVTTSNVGFIGVFDGAGRTIANARITAEALSQVGFVRLLGTRELNGSSGTLKNINFKNLSVRGLGYIGGLAGEVNGAGLISNIKIEGGEVEAKSNYSGGVSGNSQGSFVFEKILVKKFKVRGTDYVGGLVGQNSSALRGSMFSGIVVTDQINAADYAGGLVGKNLGGAIISSSFSEGYIGAQTNNIGGIAAKNYGIMENVYSTMAISSLRNNPGSMQAGGITAYNEGTITNCFSDTRKMYVGGGTMTYSGTVVGGPGAITACFTDTTNSSSHTTSAYSNLRSLTWLSTNFLAVVNASDAWKLGASNGSIPRLSWEERECLLADNLQSVTDQITNLGRGGNQDNPVVICHLTQLQSISGRNGNEFYRLGEDINISSLGIVSNSVYGVATLNGKLNGNNKALYGLDVNIDNVMDNAVGIFKTVSVGAKISNLNIYANRIYTSADSVTGVGLLTNINNGEIQNVNVYSSSVTATQTLGIISAQNTNSGVIKNVKINGAHLVGDSYIGSIAAQNNGRIEAVSTNVNIGSSVAAFAVGGVSGQNNPNGIIEQVMVEGSLNLTNGPPRNIGGIAGVNYGVVNNSYVSNNMVMNLAISSSSEAIGGLVGSNEAGSQLQKSFSVGKIIGTQSSSDLTSKLDIVSSTDEREIGPLVGKNMGSNISGALSVYDFLLWGGAGQNVVSCDSGSNTIVVAAAPALTSGVLSFHKFPFLIPFTATGNSLVLTGISLSGQCPSNGDYLTFYQSYHNFAEHGEVASFADLKSLSYLNNKGFNVTYDNDPRSIAYHLARMNGTAIPANTPIWTIEDGEEYPRLLQLEH